VTLIPDDIPESLDHAALQGGAPPADPATGRGRSHGTSNSQPFDRWFRYPAGFASDYVSVLLQHLNLSTGLIVDPFAGSAVTGTAAREQSLSFFGIEAHPMIAELGNLKLGPPPGTVEELTRYAKSVAGTATELSASAAYQSDSETDLVQRCFSTENLTKLASLRNVIQSDTQNPWAIYLKWALLATLRDVASSRVGWPYQRPSAQRRPKYADPIARFLQRSQWIASDVEKLSNVKDDALWGRVVNGDSRNEISWQGLPEKMGDGCISSPPYLNNFDYADATRLELYFWGDVRSWSQMCAEVRNGMLTATTQQSSLAESNSATSELEKLGSAGEQIQEITDELSVQRLKRKRGKEYDRVIPAYFCAMAYILENLQKRLRPGAPVVWLIGDSAPYSTYIDTPKLIAEIAKTKGFVFEEDTTLRHRGQRWSGNSSRHTVALAERLLLLRCE
jgi:hypothetical protein